jgi:hypothetical protein
LAAQWIALDVESDRGNHHRRTHLVAAPGTSTIPGALLRQGRDKEAVKTKAITKRKRSVVCGHARLYACVSERHDDRYATFVMCSNCGEVNPIDDINWRRLPNPIWSTVSSIEATRSNEGARISILAGPSSDFTTLALVALAESERRQVESLDFWYEHEVPPLLKTHDDELLAKVTAKRESLKRSHYADIAKRFEVAREKVRTAA